MKPAFQSLEVSLVWNPFNNGEGGGDSSAPRPSKGDKRIEHGQPRKQELTFSKSYRPPNISSIPDGFAR